jgi:DNA-binding SARP family transcriptional activator
MPLEIRLLGEMELRRGKAVVPLPQSKKTRALLAYLVITGKPHRRERLCSMLWDVADDPRAALRWSLSRLRPLVDDVDAPRLVATRDSVRFDSAGVRVDLDAVRARANDVTPHGSVADLESLAAEFRGELLEGLDLPEFDDFRAWCVAQREEARLLQVRVLRALLDRHRERPEAGLEHARALVQVDPFGIESRAGLIRLLGACGRRREAEQQLEIGTRMQQESGGGAVAALEDAWSEVCAGGGAVGGGGASEGHHPPGPPAGRVTSAQGDLVGREVPWAWLLERLDQVARQVARVVLVNGEPGVGKSRLLAELADEVVRRGGTVLEGCAYEAESGRPYGPWVDALRRVPAVSVGATLGAELAPLLPEFGRDAAREESRDRLFGAIVELVAARAHSAPPVLLVLDDVQWCDTASVELLHYVVRMSRHRPLLVALAARAGEVPDNEALQRLLRGLRHDQVLDEIDLGPLDLAAMALLVRGIAPDADVERLHQQSAGNPLFALELARESPGLGGQLPSSLRQLVRDRVDRLPTDAAEVLAWGGVLGRHFAVDLVADLTTLETDRLVAAFETLERHVLIHGASRARGGEAYVFAHDVVREVVYAEISDPRRRLMHRRVAQALALRRDADETVASDIAQHAALGGDETMAADACVTAARRSLRLFANRDAEALAKRGLRHAARLEEPERVKRILELTEVQFSARRPADAEAAARHLEELAERALDFGCAEHARLGFHLLAYVRWDEGEWTDARRQMLRAEQASRAGDDSARIVAMAEAARCLAMLERDLPSAEALLLEARALSARAALEPTSIPDAEGMLRLHQGRIGEAETLFERAHDLARREQNRGAEYNALEHLVRVALQRGDFGLAAERSSHLCRIAGRLREGSEAPFARALAAVSRYAVDGMPAAGELDSSVEALRHADAKHRLAYVLLRAAEADLWRGDYALAGSRAQEALAAAATLGRPTETVQARWVLARAALACGERSVAVAHLDAIDPAAARGAAQDACKLVDQLRCELDVPAG